MTKKRTEGGDLWLKKHRVKVHVRCVHDGPHSPDRATWSWHCDNCNAFVGRIADDEDPFSEEQDAD